MNKLEKEVESALVRMVNRHGGMCLKLGSTGQSGIPDRLILLPDGRTMFVELKRPEGGKISKLQLWWARRLQSLGFVHRFVHNQGDISLLEMEMENR
ncbi:MAG: VRR-NUC domain-containing protein [Akkermansia sp.]|nr:VRR-NUC domain-containing protein [Akkermansia sp.]